MTNIMNTSKPKLKVQTPACVLPHVSGMFKVVASDGEFIFPKLCPYCGGDLLYRGTGWIEDERGQWKVDMMDCECSTMPDFDDEEWDDWMNNHSEMPYVHQLSVDQAVIKWINARYRFAVD